MAFLGRCYGCRDGRHADHTYQFDTPPTDVFILGGGICVCRECEPGTEHLDRWEDE